MSGVRSRKIASSRSQFGTGLSASLEVAPRQEYPTDFQDFDPSKLTILMLDVEGILQ